MEKIIKLQEWLSINTTITVILFDSITLLYKKYEREEIWEMEYTIEMLKKMITAESDFKILDNLLAWEFSEDVMKKLDDWGEIIHKIVLDFIEEKKKLQKQSEDTNKQSIVKSEKK